MPTCESYQAKEGNQQDIAGRERITTVGVPGRERVLVNLTLTSSLISPSISFIIYVISINVCKSIVLSTLL